ncbi:MAG: clostripain-related cysteine peptidase [Candidatus Eremiobacteraeota bacterium]|nr:clostripain-related cysteine peptidase [Candidatus Eremiobacteraeota bacterium]
MTQIQPAGHSPYFERAQGMPAPQAHENEGASCDTVSLGEAPPDDGTPGVEKKKWTVMLYSAADNNLEDALLQDAIDLESVGSDKNTNVLLQLDRGKNPSSMSGAWPGCHRYFLNNDSDGKNLNSPVLNDMGQVNMADPKTLTDFISWGMKNYPAEHYMVIISDHGGGWPGAVEDDSHGGWMKTRDINKALEDAAKEGGQKLDIVGFDACLMATSEVGYELKDSAGFMVASENTEGADGWPYPQILTQKSLRNLQRALREKLDITPEEVAKKIIKDAEGFQHSLSTLSAVDLSKMKDVAAATDAFADKLMATATPRETLRNIIKSTKSWYGFKDQFDFAERIINSKDVKDEELKTAAKSMMEAIGTAVIAEQHTAAHKGAHGLTIELPSYPSAPSDEYKELKLSQDTKWDEALGKLSS